LTHHDELTDKSGYRDACLRKGAGVAGL
jgi:hypothetical protein